MAFGKMNAFIDIVESSISKDSEGFATSADLVLKSVRAYREDRHGTTMWANRAAFSTASCLFRFRVIPNIEITTKLQILCGGKRYKILSVEDIRNRGMYTECLCERLEVSKGG